MGLFGKTIKRNDKKEVTVHTVLSEKDEFDRMADEFFTQLTRSYRKLDTWDKYDQEHKLYNYEVYSRELNTPFNKNKHLVLGKILETHEGRTKFRENFGKFGFIDETAIVVVPPIYDYASDFNNGLAVVGIDGEYGIIGRFGECIVPVKYTNTSKVDTSDKGYSYCMGNLFQAMGEIIVVQCPHKKYDIYTKTGKFLIQLESGNFSSINCSYNLNIISIDMANILLDIIIRVEDYRVRLIEMKNALKNDDKRLKELYKPTKEQYIENIRKDIRYTSNSKAVAKEILALALGSRKDDSFYKALKPMLDEEINRHVEYYDPHPACCCD